MIKPETLYEKAARKTAHGGDPEQFLSAHQEALELDVMMWECPYCRHWQPMKYVQKEITYINKKGELVDHLKKIPVWECRNCGA